MLAANRKITIRQLQILIILSAMGTGVIVLPRRAAEFAGEDGWFIVAWLTVIAVLIGMFISTAVNAATKAKPDAGFIEFTGILLTRPVAYVCGVVLWLKLVVSAGLELRIFMEITQSVMLPKTPVAVVSAVVLTVCAYAAIKGMETRARVAEILFAVMALPFIFLVILAFFDTNFANLQPVLATPPRDLLQGTLRLGFVFTGLECLLLVSPFLRKGSKHMARHVAGALGLAGGIILVITVLTIVKFGPGVIDQQWPVLRMMDMVNIPGSFIQWHETLVFAFWIITTFAIVNMMLFFGGVLVKDIFRPKSWYLGVIITTAAVFAVSVFPWGDVYKVLDSMYFTVGIFFMIVLPVILLAAAKLRKATLLLLACTLLLTSCQDRVEIEDRAFITAIGVDSDNGEYAVTLAVPLLKKDGDEDSDESHHTKTATGQTITEAFKKLDAKTDKTLYYGQAKLLVFGSSLLNDGDMTGSVINAVKNKPEIDLRLNVLATNGSAKDILEAKPPEETLPGLFAADIYRSKSRLGGSSFALNLQQLANSYKNDAVIPMIKNEDCKETPLKLDGAVVIKNRQKTGELSAEELQGFLWCVNRGNNGAVVTVEYGGNLVPIKIMKHTAKICFRPSAENEKGLQAAVNIKVTAKLDESPAKYADMAQIKEMLAEQIIKEIFATADKLQNEYATDGYGWLELLRQKNYCLYKLHSDNWEDVFPEIEVVADITVSL
ncbi:MAG: Ger(x)C family spore germination protein [Firmicutes bacterium]|nr:Ger(x)C family spore germination protein [Bacillota bacterium]